MQTIGSTTSVKTQMKCQAAYLDLLVHNLQPADMRLRQTGKREKKALHTIHVSRKTEGEAQNMTHQLDDAC